jgi:isoleucyl-tRNA synthetase
VKRAVSRFGDQLRDELNVKRVRQDYDPERLSPLIPVIQPNMKVFGPKFGPRLNEVKAALASLVPDPRGNRSAFTEAMLRHSTGQPFELTSPGGPVVIEPSDVVIQFQAPDGWAGVSDRGADVLLDIRVTEELVREGMAREVVRHVQETRKEAKLEMADRIELHLATDSAKLRQAIDAFRDYIGGETLVVQWSEQPLNGEAFQSTVKVDGQALTIQLRPIAART